MCNLLKYTLILDTDLGLFINMLPYAPHEGIPGRRDGRTLPKMLPPSFVVNKNIKIKLALSS